MSVKTKGVTLIIVGIIGAIFIAMFDTIMGKARNYIGPKSIAALIACVFLIIQGIIYSLKKAKV